MVMLVTECLSKSELKVSCLIEEGDSPQYSWTLDGNTLTDSELISGNNGTNFIILRQNVSGRLLCSVRNHISRVSKGEFISPCNAAEAYCDARQKGAQCYGALGGTVAFKLMDKTSEKHRFILKKEVSVTNESNQIILFVRSNVIISNTMSSRSVFILNNGTFKINNLSRSDGGKYTLEIFGSDRKRKENRTLQLHVQAPVSSVRMISECVAQLLKVSCLSEGGDSPQYSWFLNGQPTGDTEIVNRNPVNNIIILKQNMSGYLTCSVWNKISRVSEERRISLCEGQ
ncbi:PREDICTED: uncharacterized protein LOC106920298 [Poecilia mexicana]|uniref:uncharacterized protein LOC106920298 n=1 Tax=Poecilia mexicana TaxID=48701 RepID=UPI00072E8BEB|nr:PREDICTED: uncharacterized protein LOC106920298 [Poecilia mexicana]